MFHVGIVAIRSGVLSCSYQHQNSSFDRRVIYEMIQKLLMRIAYALHSGEKTDETGSRGHFAW